MIQNEFRCLFSLFIYLLQSSFMRISYYTWAREEIKGLFELWDRSTVPFPSLSAWEMHGSFAVAASCGSCLPVRAALCYITQRRAQGFCARCTGTRCSKAPGLVLCSGVHTWMNKEKITRYKIPAFARKKAQKGVWLLCNTYLCFHKFYVFIKIW